MGFNELAELAGISKPTLMMIERDNGWLPSSRNMLALCEALACDFHDIWYEDPWQEGGAT